MYTFHRKRENGVEKGKRRVFTMMKRICPICDQVMKLPHYCETCRSFVKDPWIRDVSYYLNERHPESEGACTYHGGLEVDPGKDNIWDVITAKQAIQKRMAERMDRKEQQPHQTKQAQPNVPRESTKKKTEKKLSGVQIVLIVMAIYLAFQALVAGITVVGDSILNLFDNRIEYHVDFGDYPSDPTVKNDMPPEL
jgi:hypothetical protein